MKTRVRKHIQKSRKKIYNSAICLLFLAWIFLTWIITLTISFYIIDASLAVQYSAIWIMFLAITSSWHLSWKNIKLSQVWYMNRKKYQQLNTKWKSYKYDPHFLNHHNYGPTKSVTQDYQEYASKNIFRVLSICFWVINIISTVLALIAYAWGEDFLKSFFMTFTMCSFFPLIWVYAILVNKFSSKKSLKKLYASKIHAKNFITIGTRKIFFD